MNKNINYGFVKILKGESKGRIGRYVRDEQDISKAVVAFSYWIDVIPYSNYKKFSHTSLTNIITKKDLIDRYFIIEKELNAIDLRNHKTIKKFSPDHTDLICELTLIKMLLKDSYNIDKLNDMKREENIIISGSFKDGLWINDLAFELEERHYFVAIIDHELLSDMISLKENNQKANTVLFVLSKESLKDNFLEEEYDYCKKNNDIVNKIIFVKKDDVKTPSIALKYYDLTGQYTDNYDTELSNLISDLNNY